MRLSVMSVAALLALSACSPPEATPQGGTKPDPLAAKTEPTRAAESATPTATPKRTAKEKAFLRAARKDISDGNSDATDDELIGLGRDFCGQGDEETVYDGYGGNPPNVEDLARAKGSPMITSVERSAVLVFCPKYIKTWKQAMGGFFDGEHPIGGKRGIKPGRYRTLDKGLKGCYWERTSKGGDTLANALVTYAPGYIQVTILPGDGGFSSNEECYFWVPADL